MELPYDGEEGRTRRVTVHVPAPGGGTRTLSVLRSVNVHTDPALREETLAGRLHQTEVGPLAVPFVYHDPEARRFVLVVPEVLAHRVLHERAALLTRLADEARELPGYVAAADVVLGVAGLEAYLAQETPEVAASAARDREASLRSQAEGLAARESRLVAAEARLSVDGERLEALLREVEVRERELETRLDALQEREAQLLAEAVELEGEPTAAGRGSATDLASSVELVDEDAELVGESTDSHQPFEDAQTIGELEPLDPSEVSEISELRPLPTSVLDDDEVELLEDEPPDSSELKLDDGPSHMEKRIPTPATPPPEFFTDSSVQMMATMPDGPWLFTRLGEGHEEAFRGAPELMAQYIAIDGTPVVLLALVERSEPRPYARRAALDPTDEGDRAILDALRDGQLATAAVFGPAGRFERTFRLELGPRRANLAAILRRADRDAGSSDAEAIAVAMERALAAPPPLTLRGHPFQDAPAATNAIEALRAVEALEKWSKPAKMDMAILALSIPRDVVDDSFRRILADALQHGIAIRGPLVSRAVSLGVVAEPGEMVERLVDAFRGTARLAGKGGLDERGVAKNWEALLGLAEEYEVALDSDAHEQAHADMSVARGGSRAPDSVDETRLTELPTEQLVGLVEHPKLRRPVALELLGRAGPGDEKMIARVVRAVRKMPRDEVLEVMPRVFPLGEAAADALIDTLTARKTFVRQAAALCLGQLQMRRAVRPLVQLLVEEPSEVWEEVARVLASFGRSMERSLRRVAEVDGAPERIAYLLAHVRLNGDAAFVDALGSDGETLRPSALEAPAQEERADEHRRRLNGHAKPEEDDPVREFSRRFLAQVNTSAGG